MSGEPFTGQPPNRAEASKRITHPEDGSQAAWLLEERKNFPELGSKIWLDKVEYTVTSVNIISKVVKIENEEDVKFITLSDLKKQTRWRRPRENEEK